MVAVVDAPVLLGDGKHLVEIAVAVGLRTLLHHATHRIVRVLRHLAIRVRGGDELVCGIIGVGRLPPAHGLFEDVARRVVDVPLHVLADPCEERLRMEPTVLRVCRMR